MLFSPFRMRGLTLANRIVVSPMCQYSAVNGIAGDWHIVHLGGLGLSGAGLLMLEATAVSVEGRITPGCLGLWSDEHAAALSRVLSIVRRYSPIAIGIQLSHAGRKASSRSPADGGGPLPREEGAWQAIGPDVIPFADRPPPKMMDRSDMDRIVTAFVKAAISADRVGFDLIELHGAHGYLIGSFLSPLANQRHDRYGGSLANRMRFPLEIFEAVRAVWPAEKPLGMRINGSDWAARGITIEEAAEFAIALRERGCDFVDLSSGGNQRANIPATPGYQVPFAAHVRKMAGIPTIAVGLIRDPHHAEQALVNGQADLIAIARGFLAEPRWPWRAARELGGAVHIPPQWARAASRAIQRA